MLTRIYHIIKRDVRVEMRERFSFLSSILYLVAITFVVYKIFGTLEGATKVGLFWVLLVFTAINTVGTSFSQISQKRKLNHYQLYDATELMIGKLLVNFFKLFIAGLILLGLQCLFSNELLKQPQMFFQGFFLASIGLVAIMTLVSGIAVYSQNQNGLVAILSLPLLIPILLLGMNVSIISESPESMSLGDTVNNYLYMLLGIDIVLVVLTIIFIPIIWKS